MSKIAWKRKFIILIIQRTYVSHHVWVAHGIPRRGRGSSLRCSCEGGTWTLGTVASSWRRWLGKPAVVGAACAGLNPGADRGTGILPHKTSWEEKKFYMYYIFQFSWVMLNWTIQSINQFNLLKTLFNFVIILVSVCPTWTSRITEVCT